jgi:excisionase family DNA binding protein
MVESIFDFFHTMHFFANANFLLFSVLDLSYLFHKMLKIYSILMAFTLDRDGAATRLWVSSRTIDRHIQAGRIRTRRIGKKTFLDDTDVDMLRDGNFSRTEREDDTIIILDEKEISSHEIIHPSKSQAIDTVAVTELVRLYEETRGIIAKKDSVIQDLSYKLWKIETELKSSISLLEYNKATLLLESSKVRSDSDRETLSSKISLLEKEVNKKNSAIITLAVLFVLVLGFSIVFFLFTRLI